MLVNKILKVVLLLLGGLYIIFQGFAFEIEGAVVSTIMLVLLTILYCGWTKNSTNFFVGFLVAFTLAHILSLYSYYAPEIGKDQIDYYYYGANTLYIIAYILLIIKIIRGLDIRAVISELTIPILILIVLDVFCVSIVTDTTGDALIGNEYKLEYIYNAVLMTLLSVALINYMYRNDNKSMLFLVGSICIVFSEIIQLAYFYILPHNDLGFIYSLFLVIAFLFFYIQSQFEFTGPDHIYQDGHIEAEFFFRNGIFCL
jgi:hypothetical protein